MKDIKIPKNNPLKNPFQVNIHRLVDDLTSLSYKGLVKVSAINFS